MTSVTIGLESMDAAGRVSHPSPTRPNARRSVRRGWPLVSAAFEVFFFFPDSRRIGLIRTESASIRAKPGWFGHIESYWPVTDTVDTAKIGRKRLKQAEIGLETR